MRKFLYPAAMAMAIGFSLIGWAQVEAAGYAGHWKATLATRCANSPLNAAVCRFVQGRVAAIGKTGTTFGFTGTDSLTVAANGRYTDAGTETITETAPGAKTHGCPLNSVGTTLFNGSCALTWTGTGHIIMKRGLPVFYTDAQTLTFKGKVIGTVKGAQANSGPPLPAKPGTFGATWAAQQAGASKAPSGFTYQLVVTRSA
jgi:hypothetical protein